MTIVKWLSTDYGIKFTQIQHYQVRLEKNKSRIDIFPQSKKYHNISSNRRGYDKNLTEFLITFFDLRLK